MKSYYNKLYHEEKSGNFDGEMYTDEVSVQMSYFSGGNMCCYVLKTYVVLDGERQFTTFKAFDGDEFDDPEMIRLAIKEFDELKAAHPGFAAVETKGE